MTEPLLKGKIGNVLTMKIFENLCRIYTSEKLPHGKIVISMFIALPLLIVNIHVNEGININISVNNHVMLI